MDILIIEDDNQFEGARKGINLPLMLYGNVVGVIGVTGEHAEVVKYVQIVKNMTETIMEENAQLEQKKIDDRILARFLDEWILDGVPLSPDMIERGARLGIDIKQHYRVLVIVLANLRSYNDTALGQTLIDNVNRTLRQMIEKIPGGVFTKTATKMICVLPGKNTDAMMMEKALHLISALEERFDTPLFAGIDGDAENIHLAYHQASKAVQGCNSHNKNISFYDDIGLEIFMDEIPLSHRIAFVRRIFQGIQEKDLPHYLTLLEVYFSVNGSITKASEQLFLHKNTLQYRLKKFHEKTGYNPRLLEDSALIFLAIQFYHSVEYQ
ncbi:MAG: hypothetical protein GX786_08275 [Clostridiales bacterium]|nr:hypothetical protein [Clostridiales bacterium]